MKKEKNIILGILLIIMVNIVLLAIHNHDKKTQEAMSLGYYTVSNN